MDSWRRVRGLLWTVCFILALTSVMWAQAAPVAQEGFQPQVGQAGKDVVWVPTPYVLVEKMLDMAKVTPQDFVMDLGSGDGRNIIAAAKRGAKSVGVEFNPNMIELSRKTAAKEGVSDRATFIEGDMFEQTFRRRPSLRCFSCPTISSAHAKVPRAPTGTRIVGNTFASRVGPDETDTSGGDCGSWCSLSCDRAGQSGGRVAIAEGQLALSQAFRSLPALTVGGTPTPIVNGKLRGEQISFSVGGTEYTGRVNGDSMSGTAKSGSATAMERDTRFQVARSSSSAGNCYLRP